MCCLEKPSEGGAAGKAKTTEGGKPDWKKLRQERKALKEFRKKKEMKPDFYLITKKAKEIWEELRKSTVPDEERAKMCEKVFSLIQDNVKRVSANTTICWTFVS
jgi:hypothetical protein